MKKWLILLLCLLLCAPTALGEGEPTFQDIVAANQADVVFASHYGVKAIMERYSSFTSTEPEVYEFQLDKAGTRLMGMPAYYYYYMENDALYVHNIGADISGSIFYTEGDDDYRNIHSIDGFLFLQYSDQEIITAVEQTERGLEVQTELALDEESIRLYQETWEISDDAHERYLYVLDPETLLLQSYQQFIVDENWDLEVTTATFTYLNEPIAQPAFMQALATATETHTATIHLNGEVYTFTVPKAWHTYFNTPEGYEPFADEDRTPLPDSFSTSGSDFDVYMLPEE